MKTLFASDIAKAMGLCILLSFIVCAISYAETHYIRKGEVISTDANEILIEDTTGNVWGIVGQDLTKGDKVVMTMIDKHTSNNIKDDEVVNVKIVNK